MEGSVQLYGRQQSVCEDKALKDNTHFNLTNIALLLLLIRLVNPNKGGLDKVQSAAKTNAAIHRSIAVGGCGVL